MANELILVIDDDPGTREVIRYALETEGFSVLCAASAEDALDQLDGRPVKLILLDYLLPGMGGQAFLNLLSADRTGLGRVPLILMTASNACPRLRPTDSFLRKPFDLETLLFHVHSYCRRSI